MAIYQTVLEQVEKGATCRVDLKQRTLKVNNKTVELVEPLGIDKFDNLDDWLDKAEELYDDYKYSRPTAKTKSRAYFKALNLDGLVGELGREALLNDTSREYAQAALEVFILLSLVNDSFNPDELFAKDWYYQGTDKSFIILKNFFN